jgi:Peptidase C13 family
MQNTIDDPQHAPIRIDSSVLTDTPAATPQTSYGNYFRDALNVALFRAPRWQRLPAASPGFALSICLLSLVIEFVASYAQVAPNARFYPQAIAAGWLGVATLIWACWATLHHDDHPDPDLRYKPVVTLRVTVGSLFSLALLATAIIYTITSAIYIPLHRADAFPEESWGVFLQWALWGLGIAWALIAQIVLLVRAAPTASFSSAAILLLFATAGIHIWAQPSSFWYPDYESEEGSADSKTKWDSSHLQPAKLLKQAGLLDAALAALPAQRPGIVDTYVITYSPYASEDVFLKESDVVSKVMNDRFGAGARTIRMVNHASTIESLPWATPESLKKTLDHIGKIIDPAEDMVFIHFASHGGSDGKLEAEFWPLQMEKLTGTSVRAMFDDANIPVRLLSISACYSGSWIEPLRTEGTLVMTASDAEHTSYGCGRKSELTYFTRAVFSEQLANNTRSFEDALKAARPIIEAREKQAGKKDGFSNPQIFVGDVARARMQRWTSEIAASEVTKATDATNAVSTTNATNSIKISPQKL